uniref:Uncharacterized protein n=1 Tax=Pyxicephalus adspersus TaxID=30357 RepID=A0AAV2ZQ32_PYXAD|nr:TPA: hypothetical protein GDO54_003922 [Pyxicephalus adspersus]
MFSVLCTSCRAAADARENIRHPEDAETAADTEDGTTATSEPTPAPEVPAAPAQEPAEATVPGSPDVALSEIPAAADVIQ